jgi:hypothetical protein
MKKKIQFLILFVITAVYSNAQNVMPLPGHSDYKVSYETWELVNKTQNDNYNRTHDYKYTPPNHYDNSKSNSSGTSSGPAIIEDDEKTVSFTNRGAVFNYHNGDKYVGNFGTESNRYTASNSSETKYIRKGDGKLTRENGDIYDGFWQGDKRKGWGHMVWKDQQLSYLGNWEHDTINGSGEMIFASTDKYYGEWYNGKMQGKGKYTYADGTVYEGEFSNNKFHGLGKLTAKDGTVIHDGKWEYNNFVAGSEPATEGTVNITYSDGRKFEGTLIDGKKNGWGKYTNPNFYGKTEVEEGNWKDDQLDGDGTITINGKLSYKGHFVNGKWDGQGTYYMGGQERIEGNWKQNHMNGYCIHYGPDGNIIEEGYYEMDVYKGKDR